MSESELVDMNITSEPRNIRYFDKEDELTMGEAQRYLTIMMLTTFKNYLQSLSRSEQIYVINDMIDFICTTDDTIITVNRKDKIIAELKEIRHKLLFKQ